VGLVPYLAPDLGGFNLERIKEFKHYIVLSKLNENHGYWMRIYSATKINNLKAIIYNKHKYVIDRKRVFSLHGWYPFLKENRWNAWRQVYNMLYRYFIATGLLYYEEPEPDKKPKGSENIPENPIYPMTWSVAQEKWTPGLVQAVNLSKLEQRYNKHINFGSFVMSWKMALVLGVIAIVILLFLTRRLPL
jgi:hypothetical protein